MKKKKAKWTKIKTYDRSFLYVYNTPWYYSFEKLHIRLLKRFRPQEKYPLITEKEIDKIKQIVNSAYPDGSSQINDLDTEPKLLGFCMALDVNQVYYLMTDNWYLIITSHNNCYEIVEFDAIDGKCNDIFFVFDYILNNFKHKPIIADCRDTTSFPLLASLERHGRIKIENDHVRQKKSDLMHYVKFRVIRHKRSRKH